MEEISPVRLHITAGPSSGQSLPLAAGETVIGRLPTVQVSIDHPGLSRRHARLFCRDDRYYLEDLGSSNGTFLNGQRIQAAVELHSGDKIGLGPVVVVEFEDPRERAAPAAYMATIIESAGPTELALEPPALQPSQPAAPPPPPLPELFVTAPGITPKKFTLEKASLTLGRGEDNDIVIPARVVSRHQARLEKVDDTYQITPLPSASNPATVRGAPLLAAYRLSHGDEVVIGADVPGMAVTLAFLNLAQAGKPVAERTLMPGAAAPDVTIPSEQPLPPSPPVKPQRPVQAPPHESQQPPSDRTMIDSSASLGPPKTPAQLVVTVAGQPSQTYTLTRGTVRIGRAEDNDIVISSLIISRQHAQLEAVAGGYDLVIQPGVTNTLSCQGRPVSGRTRLHHGDVLRIDSEVPGLMVSMVYQSPAEQEVGALAQAIRFGEKEKLTIGRDASNDIVLDRPNVSRFHAQVERVGRRYHLTDLRSSNGTFVNDERIEGQVWLQAGDSIRIGSYRFSLGEDQVMQYDESSGMRVEAVGLNKWVRKNLNILENISLVFQPREFVVVVGQSGGGKSTLVDAIAGYRPATHGKVVVNGVDVYHNFDAVRNEIGFVPQKDIIHTELTVYQALDYAARLRMPRDTTKEERHKRILEVLDDLDLAHRKGNAISSLSGGQQKRVSIGVELLTRPGLFFLDEPTSGLDPGTETAFMHLCRRLADQGRTIVMVTHATKNVMLADKVVFLARGGHLAWFGPPDEALAYFDQYRSERERRTKSMEFDQIYAILDDTSKGKAADWAQRYKENPAYQRYIVQPLQTRQGELPLAAAAKPAPARRKKRRSQISSLRQLSILSARNIKILTRDRSSLILMLAAAPLVGALDLVIAPLMGRAPFDYMTGDAPNGIITLFLLTVYALLVGGLSQMREFVKESDIYRRERLVNLKIFPYVTSKVWVALMLAFYHGAAYTLLHYLAFDMPGTTLDFGLFYITVVLAVMAGMMAGLLASAISPAASSAPLIMILLIVPQIVLSGALAPVPTNVSAIASTRWALEGFVGIAGVGSDVAADPCWQLSEELRDAMTLEDKAANGCSCMGLAIFQPGSCNFPGVGAYYEPEVDMPAPAQPAELAPRPAEPVLPPAPEPPQDRNDQVKMAQYLNSLQAYQADAERIQADYKNQMALYEANAKVYEAQMADYQEALTKYELKRNGAVKGAEGLIESVTNEFGWTWVNKDDSDVFWSRLTRAWAAQLVLVAVYFVIILFLIKRKDVR